MAKKIAVLGSTGYIGKQALEVIAQYPRQFKVEVLTAHNQPDELIKQAKRIKPRAVVITNTKNYNYLKKALTGFPINVYAGADSIAQIVTADYVDTVIGAIVGYPGLAPIISAIKAKKSIALANKEVLVLAGALIMELCEKYGVDILPIDSEHSAIYQCLMGEELDAIEKIILTASGGPFLGRDFNSLKNVTPQDALNHPIWNMGNKITIDSATLMNKGLEVIEAKWLFGLSTEQIEVVIHPQSIIHSMVQFSDGSIKAQMGLPDMKLPILFALSYPKRFPTEFPRFSFVDYPKLTFETPNYETFYCLKLAYRALDRGGNTPCALNAANEVAVSHFLKNSIRFTDIPLIVEKCMETIDFIENPTYDDYIQTHSETVKFAGELINVKNKK